MDFNIKKLTIFPNKNDQYDHMHDRVPADKGKNKLLVHMIYQDILKK